MTQTKSDDGVLAAVLERFEKFRLPRALDIKDKVDRGETLDQSDLDFLERVLADAMDVKRRVDDRPDLQPLYARGVNLYHEITTKALENERNS